MSPDAEKERQDSAAAKAVWEELAVRARSLHCPDHYAPPWKVVVSGDRRGKFSLRIYGCCPKLQTLTSEMIRKDPRMSGPS